MLLDPLPTLYARYDLNALLLKFFGDGIRNSLIFHRQQTRRGIE
jgi:hypothetical protein